MRIDSLNGYIHPPLSLSHISLKVDSIKTPESHNVFQSALSASQTVSEKLANINGMVRAHEQAHLAAIGPYARGPVQYDYLITPDGERYAVGGSIAVDLRPVPGDPEATIRKAQALIRSAYSPSTPSSADMKVAAKAYQMEMQAKRELAADKAKEEAGTEQEHISLSA